MNESIQVVLCGLGRYSRERSILPVLSKFADHLQVVGVTSILEGEYLSLVVPAFQSIGMSPPTHFRNLEDALVANPVNPRNGHHIVVISTPNMYHFQQSFDALSKGYSVFIEKPVVTHKDDLFHLLRLAESRGLSICIGTQRRLEGGVEYCHSAISQNRDFGKLRRIILHLSVHHEVTGWRNSTELAHGGIVIDTGYHFLDIIGWILHGLGISVPGDLTGFVVLGGSEEVDSRSHKHITLEATASGILELPRQIVFSFDLSYISPKGNITERLEFHDDLGSMIVLERIMPFRHSTPWSTTRLTHRRSDGGFASLESESGLTTRLDNVAFDDPISSISRNATPFFVFMNRFLKQGISLNDLSQRIEARQSVNTWQLMRNIYRLGESK